jgi:hypothetical protein
MPAGYAGTYNSVDVADWRPTDFYLYLMPAVYAFTISANSFTAWRATSDFQMYSNALTELQIDTILSDLYAAAITPRTATGGTINVGGTNAAPSGTYQAACPPTTGKEYAYELRNDSCGLFNNWATVTITT